VQTLCTLKLGLKYVDLYLIHHPRLAKPDLATAWREFEKIKADGLAKWVSDAVGLSRFVLTAFLGALALATSASMISKHFSPLPKSNRQSIK
jgi:diketogulonate reductase-like aldo/keto reductase